MGGNNGDRSVSIGKGAGMGPVNRYFSETLETIAEKVRERLSLARLVLVEVDPPSGKFNVIVTVGTEGVLKRGGPYPLEEFIPAPLIERQKAGDVLTVGDTSELSDSWPIEQIKVSGVRSFISVPYMTGGEWRFSILGSRMRPSEWRPDEIELLSELSARIWIRLERAQAEEALRASERRFRAMFDSTTVGFAVLSTESTFVEVNDAFCTVAGRTRDQLLETDYISLAHPADVEALRERMDALVSGDNDVFVLEKRYVRPDGSIVWVQNNVSAIRDAAGNVVNLVAIAQDVTVRHTAEIEIRRANERFRIAENASRGFVYDWDIEADHVTRSSGFGAVIGYEEGEVPETGDGWRELIHPDDRASREADVASSAGVERVSSEYRIRHKDGAWMWILDDAAVITDETGRTARLVGSAVDITARKRAENRLALVAEISELTRSIADPADLLYKVSKAVGEHLEARRCLFNEIDLENDRETVHRDYCRGAVSVAGTHRISDYSPVTSAEMVAGRTVVNRDSSTDPRTADLYATVYEPNGEQAYIAVPLLRGGKWVASLWVSDDRPRDWDVQEISLLETVAERTWTAIQKLRADSALRESEARFRLVVESTPNALLMVDNTGRIRLVNSQAERLFGYCRDELLGAHVDMLVPERYRRFHASHREGFFGLPETRTMGAGRDLTCLRKDGTEVPVEIGLNPLSTNEDKFVLISIIDITERRQAQEALIRAERRAAEEYQALLQRIVPLGETLGTARELRTVYRSILEFVKSSMSCSAFFVSFFEAETSLRTAAYAWGENGELDVSQLPPIELSPAGGGPNCRAVYERKPALVSRYMDVMKNRPHIVIEDNGVDPNSAVAVPMIVGDRVLGTIEVQAYEDEAFTTEHVVALEMVANLAAVAIENVRLLEIEARARAEAEAANQMKDEFLSILSHELRTPLNAMLGWIRMLRARILDEERTEKAFEVIERNTRQQSSLIEDLLDVSRIISGKMRVEKQLVDLSAIVHDAAETMRPIAVGSGVNFSSGAAPEPVFIDGDTVRLRQVFTNLLQNAIKFTPAGGTVTIGIQSEKDGAQVTVRDTGVGIEPDFLPYIFDRFSQADASTRRAFAGLGLGLTIVKTIVDLHGGKISVDSDGPNKGAVFTVRLPFAKRILRADSLVSAEANGAAKPALVGTKILIVDDDAESIEPLQTFLSQEMAMVTLASGADEALILLAAADFDLLISDIGMPGKDGYELIRELRGSDLTKNRAIPAIALTAYASNDDRDRALEAGYHTHVPKPLDFDSLFREIKSLKKRDLSGTG